MVTLTFFLALFISKTVFAEDDTDVTVTGTINQHISSSFNEKKVHANNDDHTIQLLQITLSDEGKHLIEKRAQNILEHTDQSPSLLSHATLPQMKQLGMNDVPVLDQGIHGTCITFAITGALDAIIGKGDYISQLCHLQLGSYLEKHGYSQSGWDGNYATSVINQIEQYGIVNMDNQQQTGCGSLNRYPTYSKRDPESFIDPEAYYKMSELIFGKMVNWSNIYWRISSSWTLDEVKNAINSGDRSVFTIILPRVDLGTVGAVGNYKVKNDTWVVSSEIWSDWYWAGVGHAMIITGYDDNAVAIDNHGTQHKGILFLRNSWGPNFGNSGEFYMSYDYFKLLTFDVKRFTSKN